MNVNWIYIDYTLNTHWIESCHRSNQFHFTVFWSNQIYKFWKKKFREKICRCQEKPHWHAFDSDFKKWILLWFFKVSGYFYKQLLLQNDSTHWIHIETLHNMVQNIFNIYWINLQKCFILVLYSLNCKSCKLYTLNTLNNLKKLNTLNSLNKLNTFNTFNTFNILNTLNTLNTLHTWNT